MFLLKLKIYFIYNFFIVTRIYTIFFNVLIQK